MRRLHTGAKREVDNMTAFGRLTVRPGATVLALTPITFATVE